MKKIICLFILLAGVTACKQKGGELAKPDENTTKSTKKNSSNNMYAGKTFFQLMQVAPDCKKLSDTALNSSLAAKHYISKDVYKFIEKQLWEDKQPNEKKITSEELDSILTSGKCYVYFKPTTTLNDGDIMDKHNIEYKDTFNLAKICYPVRMFQHFKDIKASIIATKGRKIVITKPGDVTSQQILTIVLFKVTYSDENNTVYTDYYDIVEDPNS